MKLKSFLILLLAIAFVLPSQAQSKKEKKMKAAIDAINSTEFIKKYKESKEYIEKSGGEFKSIMGNYESQDVNEVIFGYEATRKQFNSIIEKIKKDLMDKKTREFMISQPDRYTDFVSKEVDFAMKNYQQTVVIKINEVTGYEQVGIGIMELKLLLDLVFDVVGVIKTIQDELDKMNEAYLDKNFVQPLRVQTWEELNK
jgi:hypothetical protein